MAEWPYITHEGLAKIVHKLDSKIKDIQGEYVKKDEYNKFASELKELMEEVAETIKSYGNRISEIEKKFVV